MNVITHDTYIIRKGQKSKILIRYTFVTQKEIPLNYFSLFMPFTSLKGGRGRGPFIFFKSFCYNFKKVSLLSPESHFFLPTAHSFFRERVINPYPTNVENRVSS